MFLFGSFQCLLSAVSLQISHITRIRSAVIRLRRHAICSLRTAQRPMSPLPVATGLQCVRGTLCQEFISLKAPKQITAIQMVACSTFKAMLFHLRTYGRGCLHNSNVGSRLCSTLDERNREEKCPPMITSWLRKVNVSQSSSRSRIFHSRTQKSHTLLAIIIKHGVSVSEWTLLCQALLRCLWIK